MTGSSESPLSFVLCLNTCRWGGRLGFLKREVICELSVLWREETEGQKKNIYE